MAPDRQSNREGRLSRMDSSAPDETSRSSGIRWFRPSLRLVCGPAQLFISATQIAENGNSPFFRYFHFRKFNISKNRKSNRPSMSRPRKVSRTVSRFSRRLQEYVDLQRTEGSCSSQIELAKRLGLGPPQLSKLLTSAGPVSAAAAAEVCGRVTPRRIAFELLREYLQDQAAVVINLAESKGLPGFTPAEGIRTGVRIEATFEKRPEIAEVEGAAVSAIALVHQGP
jgi:hypothetical protein